MRMICLCCPGGCCGGMKISDLLSSLGGCDVANTCSLYVHSVPMDSAQCNIGYCTLCRMKVEWPLLEMHIVWTCKIAHCTLLWVTSQGAIWRRMGPKQEQLNCSQEKYQLPEKYLLSAIKRNTCFFNIRHRFTYILRFIFGQNLIWKSKKKRIEGTFLE